MLMELEAKLDQYMDTQEQKLYLTQVFLLGVAHIVRVKVGQFWETRLYASQWGLQSIPAQETTLALPLSYSTLFTAAAGGGNSNGTWVYMNIDNNTVSVGVRGTTGYITDIVSFIALCKQQWGYYGTIASTTSVTCDLNIAFTTAGYFVHTATPTLNGSSRGIVGGAPKSTTQITLSNGNDKINDARWIAIGKQQWGENNTTDRHFENVTITYPLSFSNTTYYLLVSKRDDFYNDYGGTHAGVTSRTNNSFVANTNFTRQISWLVIGKQQWGKLTHTITHLTADRTVTLPISISTLLSCITTTIGDEYQACNASYKSHTTNSIVIRDGGVNDASRITGFYWCCLAI